jgi:hypothetical protein
MHQIQARNVRLGSVGFFTEYFEYNLKARSKLGIQSEESLSRTTTEIKQQPRAEPII